jgi:type IV pilus assembly protein PilO
MTETRKWTVGAALVAVLILVAGWFLLVSPKRAEVADLQAQADQQLATNSSLQTELEVLKQQNKDLPEMQSDLAALQTKIPQTAELPTYIREMQDIGKQSGVQFTSLTPAAAVSLGAATTGVATTGAAATGGALVPEELAAINVDMVVTGSYFEITKFVNELETSSRYTLLGSFSIAEVEDTEEGGVGTGSSELTATLSARIFLTPAAPEVAAPTAPITTPAS